MRISSTPVMSTELRCRVMVGGVMSGVGTGVGVGVGEGVGDVLSSLPPHEVKMVADNHAIINTTVARNAATREFLMLPDSLLAMAGRCAAMSFVFCLKDLNQVIRCTWVSVGVVFPH
jgi:hypothetical protein